jgi:microcystin-dependent protein
MRFLSGFRTAALVAGALAGAAFATPAHAEQSPYVGEVMFFTRATGCPSGWEPADGRMLKIIEYTNLYAVIGNTYGGDGQTTFALPDLRGRIVRGVGQGPGLSNVTLGQKGGAESVTLTPNNLGILVSSNIKLAPAPATPPPGWRSMAPATPPPGPANARGAIENTIPELESVPTSAPTLVVLACVATLGAYPSAY